MSRTLEQCLIMKAKQLFPLADYLPETSVRHARREWVRVALATNMYVLVT